MGKGWLLALVPVLISVSSTYYFSQHFSGFSGNVPRLFQEWWRPGSPSTDDTTIKPFKINYPKEVLEDLSHRLNNTKAFHQPLAQVGFLYGFNTKFLQTVLDFWKTKYSWDNRQDYLNSLPQFTTQVQGLKIHFIHAKPTGIKKPGLQVVPLLMLHGWPGSVREFYDIIPLLTTARASYDFAFEIIAPSLPGYGFSDAAVRPGLGAAQIAVVLHSLMQRLGYSKFVVQGGDWGSSIATCLSQMYPDSVVGLHINMALVAPVPAVLLRLAVAQVLPGLICEEGEEKFIKPIAPRYLFMLEESGYLHLQATKPDTLGVALRESPIGLAAYILEKFSTWTDPSWRHLPDGGLLKKYKLEDLLDNVMIYWLSGSATSSMRLYSETFNMKHIRLGFETAPVTVATGIARFPNELSNQPRSILSIKYRNIVHLSDLPRGGHFAAFEEPKLLADDIWKFVSNVGHPETSKD